MVHIEPSIAKTINSIKNEQRKRKNTGYGKNHINM